MDAFSLNTLLLKTGVFHLTPGHIIMWLIGFLFLYLAIKKDFEPLLLVPIGFGIFIVNLPLAPLAGKGDLIWIFYHYGLEWEVIPPLIFMGVGALTDFGPLIANPKMLLLGAAAQFGVYVTFFGAIALGFTIKEAASIGIIGGADGPTCIYLTAKLAPRLLGANAIAAYSYMALVPIIQPPIMRLFTTEADRKIVMKQLRHVSKTEKIVFPIDNPALISATSTISSDVVTTTRISLFAIPTSITRCVRRGIIRSANTIPVSKINARIVSFLYGRI
jgi:oxaloacetate decarboxylase beta subunit